MLYVPAGFGHGFLTLTDNTHFLYKCSNGYSPADEGGVLWSDPTLKIDWPIAGMDITISAKDQVQPMLKDAQL